MTSLKSIILLNLSSNSSKQLKIFFTYRNYCDLYWESKYNFNHLVIYMLPSPFIFIVYIVFILENEYIRLLGTLAEKCNLFFCPTSFHHVTLYNHSWSINDLIKFFS